MGLFDQAGQRQAAEAPVEDDPTPGDLRDHERVARDLGRGQRLRGDQTVLGEAAQLEESSHDVTLTYFIAIAVIFLVLAAQFEGFTSAVVVTLIVPFGVAAAILALLLTGAQRRHGWLIATVLAALPVFYIAQYQLVQVLRGWPVDAPEPNYSYEPVGLIDLPPGHRGYGSDERIELTMSVDEYNADVDEKQRGHGKLDTIEPIGTRIQWGAWEQAV